MKLKQQESLLLAAAAHIAVGIATQISRQSQERDPQQPALSSEFFM
jgi:hypothetical protein